MDFCLLSSAFGTGISSDNNSDKESEHGSVFRYDSFGSFGKTFGAVAKASQLYFTNVKGVHFHRPEKVAHPTEDEKKRVWVWTCFPAFGGKFKSSK